MASVWHETSSGMHEAPPSGMRRGLIAVGIVVGMAAVGLVLTKYGAELSAADRIRPIWLGVATLIWWGLGTTLAVAVTGQLRWGAIAWVLLVVIHSWLGNAVISAVNEGTWTLDPFEPPYYVMRALQMNLVLGVIPGIVGALVGHAIAKWRADPA